uniref:Uncharacterized protein n=1 Tax=Arundo donax TaxID=35708 RepID=A0A0A9A979_ARUDO
MIKHDAIVPTCLCLVLGLLAYILLSGLVSFFSNCIRKCS